MIGSQDNRESIVRVFQVIFRYLEAWFPTGPSASKSLTDVTPLAGAKRLIASDWLAIVEMILYYNEVAAHFCDDLTDLDNFIRISKPPTKEIVAFLVRVDNKSRKAGIAARKVLQALDRMERQIIKMQSGLEQQASNMKSPTLFTAPRLNALTSPSSVIHRPSAESHSRMRPREGSTFSDGDILQTLSTRIKILIPHLQFSWSQVRGYLSQIKGFLRKDDLSSIPPLIQKILDMVRSQVSFSTLAFEIRKLQVFYPVVSQKPTELLWVHKHLVACAHQISKIWRSNEPYYHPAVIDTLKAAFWTDSQNHTCLGKKYINYFGSTIEDDDAKEVPMAMLGLVGVMFALFGHKARDLQADQATKREGSEELSSPKPEPSDHEQENNSAQTLLTTMRTWKRTWM
ncbi:hypothetical protein D9758_013976 [Tetrapyrgos nigripes]|uniref:DUF6532 domain-containing protein n=1 Tax=Tetrapyrgos nigripes TaxID=182062 RepID=A0A8H5G7Q3_9AGAR|nr:hypothetical protein D9758_013976 [Tetrapyrgos nigripes]